MSSRRDMAVRLFLFCVLIIFAGRSFLFAQQVPKSDKEIPMYPGAVPYVEKGSSVNNAMGFSNISNQAGMEPNTYKTSASPEEVFNFYLQKIGGRENIEPRELERGAVSQVQYQINFYPESQITDYDMDGSMHRGAWMKQSLTKNRKPYESGKWIESAKFGWEKKESNDDLTEFEIYIQDHSFESGPGKYKTATNIEISVETHLSEQASEQASRKESHEKMDQQAKELSESLTSKPPTAEQLGVPLYPGAKFDARNSAGMSAGNDYAIYLYLTTDQPSKVAAFYEQQLKIKPADVGKDQYMIPLKGEMPVPKEGISIQPNIMFGGVAKTVITIQKMTRESQ